MPTMGSYEWGQEHLGETVSYPGHPLVLASMIMDRYESFEHASGKRPGAQYYNAISDSFIPGAGCAVTSAMDVLERALSGDMETALALAERYWKGWEEQSPRNPERGLVGRSQATRMRDGFVARVDAWRASQPLPSKYRIESEGAEVKA